MGSESCHDSCDHLRKKDVGAKRSRTRMKRGLSSIFRVRRWDVRSVSATKPVRWEGPQRIMWMEQTWTHQGSTRVDGSLKKEVYWIGQSIRLDFHDKRCKEGLLWDKDLRPQWCHITDIHLCHRWNEFLLNLKVSDKYSCRKSDKCHCTILWRHQEPQLSQETRQYKLWDFDPSTRWNKG